MHISPQTILPSNLKCAWKMIYFLVTSKCSKTGTFHMFAPYTHPVICVYEIPNNKINNKQIKVSYVLLFLGFSFPFLFKNTVKYKLNMYLLIQ